MSGPIGYEDLRAGTVRQVTQLMAAAAITGWQRPAAAIAGTRPEARGTDAAAGAWCS